MLAFGAKISAFILMSSSVYVVIMQNTRLVIGLCVSFLNVSTLFISTLLYNEFSDKKNIVIECLNVTKIEEFLDRTFRYYCQNGISFSGRINSEANQQFLDHTSIQLIFPR
jgi:hypothetical protein